MQVKVGKLNGMEGKDDEAWVVRLIVDDPLPEVFVLI